MRWSRRYVADALYAQHSMQLFQTQCYAELGLMCLIVEARNDALLQCMLEVVAPIAREVISDVLKLLTPTVVVLIDNTKQDTLECKRCKHAGQCFVFYDDRYQMCRKCIEAVKGNGNLSGAIRRMVTKVEWSYLTMWVESRK